MRVDCQRIFLAHRVLADRTAARSARKNVRTSEWEVSP